MAEEWAREEQCDQGTFNLYGALVTFFKRHAKGGHGLCAKIKGSHLQGDAAFSGLSERSICLMPSAGLHFTDINCTVIFRDPG